jgi:hypothetical protein
MASAKNKYLTGSYAIILLSTAGLKLAKIFVNGSSLFRPDPVFGFVTIRELLFLTSLLEIFVVTVLYSRRPAALKYAAVATLSSCFLAYRLGLRILYHGAASCGCLGLLEDWSMLPQAAAAAVSYTLLAFLLITSYAGLFYALREKTV